MKARLTHFAARWLIALGMLAVTPAHAEQTAGPASTVASAQALPAAQTATVMPRLAWDRVGAPMQGLA
ncbi:MAG: hypothetical protein ACUVT2_06530 [Thiobacillaceae bacterium]